MFILFLLIITIAFKITLKSSNFLLLLYFVSDFVFLHILGIRQFGKHFTPLTARVTVPRSNNKLTVHKVNLMPDIYSAKKKRKCAYNNTKFEVHSSNTTAQHFLFFFLAEYMSGRIYKV